MSSLRLMGLAGMLCFCGCTGGSGSLSRTEKAENPCRALGDDATTSSKPTMRVGYSATTPDQRRLIMIEPSSPSPSNPVRVFFGTSDRMIQRRVINDNRDHTIHLTFDLDGVAANALLTFCGPSQPFGASRIMLPDGTAISLTPVEGSQACTSMLPNDGGATLSAVSSDASLVAGNQFFCF